MVKINILLILLFISSALIGCVRTEWNAEELDRILSRYPNTFYMRGIGEVSLSSDLAICRHQSEARARAEIAKQIRVRVKEIIKDKFAQKGGEIISNLEILSQSITEEELEGVRIVKTGIDKKKGTYYAIAILSRDEAISGLEAKISDIYKSVKSQIARAEPSLKTGDISKGLGLLLSAKDNTLKAIAYEEQRNIIAAPLREVPGALRDFTGMANLSQIDARIEDILSNFEFKKTGGEGQKGKRGQRLGKPLQVKVLYAGAAAKNIPLIFSFEKGKGNLDEKVSTDEIGLAKSKVRYIAPGSPSQCEIKAHLNLKKVFPKAKELLSSQALALAHSKSALFTIDLPRWIGEDLASSASKLVEDLEKGVDLRKNIFISVEDFVLKSKFVGGSFARYFTDQLKSALAKSRKFRLLEFTLYRPPEEKKKQPLAYLKGNYWDLGKYVEVHAYLKDEKDEILTSSSVLINKEMLKEANLELLPAGYSKDVEKMVSVLAEDYGGNLGLKINLWTERGERGIYKEGENLVVHLRSNQDCFIKLFYFDAWGEITQIFPNQYHPSSRIQSDRVYRIPDEADPFQFKIQPPFGVETIKAFASTASLEKISVSSFKGIPYDTSLKNVRGIGIASEGGYDEASVVITTMRK